MASLNPPRAARLAIWLETNPKRNTLIVAILGLSVLLLSLLIPMYCLPYPLKQLNYNFSPMTFTQMNSNDVSLPVLSSGISNYSANVIDFNQTNSMLFLDLWADYPTSQGNTTSASSLNSCLIRLLCPCELHGDCHWVYW